MNCCAGRLSVPMHPLTPELDEVLLSTRIRRVWVEKGPEPKDVPFRIRWDDGVISVAEVAREWYCSPRLVKRIVKEHNLPHYYMRVKNPQSNRSYITMMLPLESVKAGLRTRFVEPVQCRR